MEGPVDRTALYGHRTGWSGAGPKYGRNWDYGQKQGSSPALVRVTGPVGTGPYRPSTVGWTGRYGRPDLLVRVPDQLVRYPDQSTVGPVPDQQVRSLGLEAPRTQKEG